MMLKLEAVFGGEVSLTLDQIDDLDISCEWEAAQMRNEMEERQIAAIDKEKFGVPDDMLLAKWYTPEEREQIEKAKNLERNQAMGQLAQLIRQQEQANAQQTPEQAQMMAAGGNGNGNVPPQLRGANGQTDLSAD